MMRKKFKQGAASFYVVAFSTLVLLIVVASFTALVVAQITRSSNDDLSQSAYDSALAGVEDAKLAYYNYQSCIAQGARAAQWDGDNNVTCGEIIWLVEYAADDCDAVGKILGRDIVPDYGVSIDELSTSNTKNNNMVQTYTCVKLQTSLKDYRSSLSTANPMRVINVKLDDMGRSEINVDAISKIKLSWGSNLNKSDLSLSNYSGGEVTFPKVTGSTSASNPPTLGLAVVQTGDDFTMEDFDLSQNGQTDRAMIYLTPTDTAGNSTSGKEGNYRGTTFYNDANAKMGVSRIEQSALVESNNVASDNYPYGVSCPYAGESEFACAAMIYLPEPIGGYRANGNFTVAVFMPYGGVQTDFTLEFFCKDGMKCGEEKVACLDDDPSCTGVVDTTQVNLKGLQIAIDSTGRANDLFRRVDTRLEGSDDFSFSIMGPLELFGEKNSNESGNDTLKKDYAVTCEYNFDPKTCN
ncbi:hypothetical protein IKE99_00785 [Candidatus Saccharibacteria bacterium]|nr:hypothetical protein [Candidatus Saccharibacteria bacterium]